LIWFDPGCTTGIVDLLIDPRWLTGTGSADFGGLRRCTVPKLVAQHGRHPFARYSDSIGHLAPKTKVPVTDEDEMIEELWDILRRRNVATVPWGIESFKAKGGGGGLSGDALSPVRVQAALTALERRVGHWFKGWPLLQPASLALSTVSDESLAEAGLYTPGGKDANMAARHALTFLRRARLNPELIEAAWPESITFLATKLGSQPLGA
jgi:hypothetical protein